MVFYRFHFAKENPELFSQCVYPVHDVSVWYEYDRSNTVDFAGEEEILMDLPQDVIDRLNAGTATIIPLTFSIPILEIKGDGRSDRLTSFAVMLHLY